MTIWSQYIAARLAAMGLAMFDVNTNLRTGRALGSLVNRIDKRHRERAEDNIRRSFPEFSEARVSSLAEESAQHLIQQVIEIVHTPQLMTDGGWAQHIEIHPSLYPAIDALNRGEPLIQITGHLGNFELLGYWLALIGYDMDALARPLDNPLIYRWLLGIRQAKGLRIITKWDASHRMRGVLQRGGVLAFIADQNAGDKGMFVPFFGRLASSYKSIGLLAVHQRVPILCGYAHRIGPGFRYEVGATDLIRPEEWESQPDPIYYVTARYVRAIEQMVRRRPGQYWWLHRRWKSRPRFERQGKPMPKGLRRQLEALPWMTPDALDRVAQNSLSE